MNVLTCAKCGGGINTSLQRQNYMYSLLNDERLRQTGKKPFSYPAIDERPLHIWIPGLSGQGKSTLMFHLALEDIRQGRGVTVIDPGGDLVEELLLPRIPEERKDDVVYVSLDRLSPIDFFSYKPNEKHQFVGELIATFKRLTELAKGQWGTRFSSILRDLLYTLFEAKERGCPVSFIDIYDFLKRPSRREQILKYVKDEENLSRWVPRFPTEDFWEPIISRMSAIGRDDRLRQMFGVPNADFTVAKAIMQKKIVLVNIGGATEAGNLLGSILVSQYQQAAFRSAKIRQEKRVPHYLYIDEFQNIQSSEFPMIISQGRKFNLCLTIANQWANQLDSDVRSAVFATGTWYVFCLHSEDLPLFKGVVRRTSYEPVYSENANLGYPLTKMFINQEDVSHTLVNLPKYHCIVRGTDKDTYKAAIPAFPEPATQQQLDFADCIRNRQILTPPRQDPPSDAELGHDEQSGPKTPRPNNSKPQPRKRSFSGPRNTGNVRNPDDQTSR